MPTTVITGANRGLGLEFTRQYAALGWRVHACARDPEAPALAAITGQVQRHRLEVTDAGEVAGLAARLQGEPVDVLLNVAGVIGRGASDTTGLRVRSLGEIDYGDWLTMLDVNLLGPVRLIEALLENVAASTQRKIATLSSVMGSIADNTSGGQLGYRSSKAGLNAVLKSLAIELAPRDIIVSVLHPGWVQTDMGGPRATVSPAESIAGMIRLIDGLRPADAGRFLRYDGSEIPW